MIFLAELAVLLIANPASLLGWFLLAKKVG